jgi:hypothetical protein
MFVIVVIGLLADKIFFSPIERFLIAVGVGQKNGQSFA